jgi:hypothetical protein
MHISLLVYSVEQSTFWFLRLCPLYLTLLACAIVKGVAENLLTKMASFRR